MTYLQTPLTIQDNMEFLAFLAENYPNQEKIITQAQDIIKFFGVQPELETISFDDRDAMMLFWDTPSENYLAMYIDGSDEVQVEELDYMGEPQTTIMTVDQAIRHYKDNWHEGLFAYEQELKSIDVVNQKAIADLTETLEDFAEQYEVDFSVQPMIELFNLVSELPADIERGEDCFWVWWQVDYGTWAVDDQYELLSIIVDKDGLTVAAELCGEEERFCETGCSPERAADLFEQWKDKIIEAAEAGLFDVNEDVVEELE